MMLPIRQCSLLKRSLLKRSLALLLTAVMLCPPAGSLLLAAQAAPASPPPGADISIPTAPQQAGIIRTILLFPFAAGPNAAGASGGYNLDTVGARLEDAVKLRLNVIGRYKADSFSPRLPQIQRALEEARVEGLTENDITPPYNDRQKGEKIAAQVGTDGYLLGNIESLGTDTGSRNVSLTVSATLYNSTTGEAVKALAYTGHGISYNPTDDPDNLLQSAINDVAGHIVSSLNDSAGRQALVPNDSARGHRDNSGSILLGLLLAVGIGLAISSTSHSSGSSSSSSSSTTTTSTGSTGSTLPPSPPNP